MFRLTSAFRRQCLLKLIAVAARNKAGKLMIATLAWCCLCLVPSPAVAQDERNPQSSVGNRERTDLRVDPVTHALQFQIPLGQYPGRAGTGIPVVLNYSSKLWNVKYMNTQQCSGGDPGSLYKVEYAKSSSSGWTETLGWFNSGTGSDDPSRELYDATTTRTSTRSTNYRKIARMYVTLPDGSRHELRKDDNFHDMNESITGLFYSVDGSRLIYDTTTRTLYMPDGSRYITAIDSTTGQPTVDTFIDRNGNQLTYNNSTKQWTDTLGRTFGLPLPTAGVGDAVGLGEQDTTYSIPGVGGALTYTLRWKHLSTAGVISEQETDQTLRYKGDYTTNCHAGTGYSWLFTSPGGTFDGFFKSNLFDPVVLSQIVLPNGQSYTFKYNIYGEITKVVYPTGGYERFAYGQAPMLSAEDGSGLYARANRGVTDAWISADGTAANEAHWSYSGFSTIAPDGTRTDRSVFTNQYDWSAYGFEDPRLGMVYDERIFAPSGTMLRRRLTDYAVDGQVEVFSGYYAYKQRNPRPVRVVDILLDTGTGTALAANTTYEYDGDLNQTVVRHYDYAAVDQGTAQSGAISSMPLGTLVRTDEAVYLVNDPSVAQGTRDAYRSRNLVALPSVLRIHQGDATGLVVSETRTRYDETALRTYGGAQGWSDPGTGARGNATAVSRWLDTTNTWLESHAEYDQFGNAWKSTDARAKVSQVEYSASYQYAYQTHTISAVPDTSGQRGSATALETFTSYDLSTGLVTSTSDANGQTTSFQYNDPLNRLKQIDRPDGGRTTYTYVDQHQCGAYVESRTLIDTSGRETDAYQFFDGLGRPYLTESNDHQDAGNPWLRVDTQYDALGRVSRVSNPYRSPGCGATVNPSGRWTTTAYDALSRVLTVTTPDGAQVKTDYDGARVLVTDQAGKQRVSVTDGLGRLAEVWEVRSDDAASGTEPLSFPSRPGVPAVAAGYKTHYDYDAMGNLRRVAQGAQQRFFMYDSLSRLIRAKNPEQAAGSVASNITDPVTGNTQWSMAYGYDANGNLNARVDARNITTTYVYDNLNRNTLVDYSNTASNPDIDRHYDNPTAGSYGRGRYYYDFYNKDDGTIDHQAVDAYDVLGRPRARRQVFYSGGQWYHYPVTRTYDRAGNVTSQTYPSGHTVSYNYDAAGRLADSGANPAFSGNLGDGWTRTYAGGLSYDEASRMREERFGTLTPLYHKLHYNVRGQLGDVRLSSVAWSSAGGEWDWNRGAFVGYYSQNDIGAATSAGHLVSGPENNGNLKRAEVYIPTDANGTYNETSAGPFAAFADNYAYDALNRLTSIGGQSYNPSSGWVATVSQAYDYDRWGNRTINAGGTSGYGVNNKQFDANDLACTNRLYAPGDTTGQCTPKPESQRQMRYDEAGNLKYDTYSGQAAQRTYDAENRMTMEQSSATSVFSYYAYDADGHRARRNTYGQETWQVYGMDGELLAEYQAQAAPIIAIKEYGYRNGQLLVTAANGDDQRLTRFIVQLYNALGRGPNSSELQSAVATLSQAASQGPSQFAQAGRDIARTLFDSAEYASRNRTDGEFVNDLYWTYCRRGPDPGGYQAWLNTVPVYGRAATRDGFAQNGEFTGIANRVYGLSSGEDERTQMYINTVYGALQRGPTSAEMTAGVNRLNAATEQGRDQVVATARAIGSEVFNSQEYANLNKSDRDFVYDLYWVFLNRAPDQGGWDAWTNSVPTYGRPSIVSGFTSGGEFQSVASALYRETLWLVPDHLGTPRMVVARTGSLSGVKRHDYLPFGEELQAGVGGRTTSLGYSQPDGLRMQLTSKERDVETGLDYFGARYYSSTQGRFTNPDRPFADQYESDPQSWNLYTYVGNSPLKYTDPLGLWKKVNCSGGSTQCYEAEEGDTYAGLAKLLGAWGIEVLDLKSFFSNQAISTGQVFDVSGFADWEKELMAARTEDAMRCCMVIPAGGGIKDVSKPAGGLLSRFFNWISRRGGSKVATTVEEEIAATRLSVPQIPGGMSIAEFGKRVMRWGTGNTEARARIATLTKTELQAAGVTREIAETWRDFYMNEMKRVPNNPSAAGRAELMQRAVELLSN
jgi:RHS repeat-associated protein